VKLIPALLVMAGAASGIYWGFERHDADLLQRRLDASADRQDDVDRRRREHDRLLRLQPAAGELERLRAEVRRATQPGRSAEPSASPLPESLRPGFWASASAWRDRGRATPEAALETMLWAASGGDIPALKDMLVLSPETRALAADIIRGLQGSSRQHYADPEDLVADLVAGNLPLDSAQLVARQQNQDDQAIEYLRLKDSRGATRLVFLSLQKGADGWKLTVPVSAVETVAGSRGEPGVP